MGRKAAYRMAWMWRNHRVAKWAALSVHKTAAKLGIHILPKHYYSPFADMADLEQTRQIWAKPSALVGVQIPPVGEQIQTLECLLRTTSDGWRRAYDRAVANGYGQGYGFIEARVLNALLRSLKPQRVVEVGGGVTSACIADAIKENGNNASHTVIEPYPSSALQRMSCIRLLKQPVQLTDFEVFEQLGSNDFLFIDSSHVVKPASDVNYLILEILPRLRNDVTIHIHDINFPYDFRPEVLQSPYVQGAEGSLLQAFLIGNDSVEVLFALSQIHHEATEQLKKLIPEFRPMPTCNGLFTESRDLLFQSKDRNKEQQLHFPSSIYLRTKAVKREARDSPSAQHLTRTA
jgi:hypothetical protein